MELFIYVEVYVHGSEDSNGRVGKRTSKHSMQSVSKLSDSRIKELEKYVAEQRQKLLEAVKEQEIANLFKNTEEIRTIVKDGIRSKFGLPRFLQLDTLVWDSIQRFWSSSKTADDVKALSNSIFGMYRMI